jgi:two-component system, NtrC family, response regulator HydG
LLCDTEFIQPTVLPFEITNFAKLQFSDTVEETSSLVATKSQPEPVAAPVANSYATASAPEPVFTKSLEINEHSLKGASIDAEYEMIVEALRKANYNKSKAAKILNVDRKTLYNKMKQYKQFNSDL